MLRRTILEIPKGQALSKKIVQRTTITRAVVDRSKLNRRSHPPRRAPVNFGDIDTVDCKTSRFPLLMRTRIRRCHAAVVFDMVSSFFYACRRLMKAGEFAAFAQGLGVTW
jgi:hypothetical protein